MAEELRSITIRKVKGIENSTFNLQSAEPAIPNKPIIMVAPNGFGKSSLAIAFDSLTSNGIKLKKEHHFQENEEEQPEIELQINRNGIVETLSATQNNNSIKNLFDIFVIRNGLKAKATTMRIGGRPIATSSLNVEDIVLESRIPDSTRFNYNVRDLKLDFGKNGKILPNINSLLSNKEFILKINNLNIRFNRIDDVRNKERIDQFIDSANDLDGTSENIINNLDFSPLENVTPIRLLAEEMAATFPNDTARYLTALTLAKTIVTSDFSGICKRYQYELNKDWAINIISPLTDTWKSLRPREKNGKLIVSFPKAHQISNGERDVVSLVAKLAEFEFKSDKQRSLLIIDDVFDYLDDANLISVQYYIGKLIEKYKKEQKKLYTIILTHLDPEYFRTFSFKKHKQKIFYLNKRPAAPDRRVEKIVLRRNDEIIGPQLSRHFFHFNNDSIEVREAEFVRLDLNTELRNSEDFYAHINEQLQNYINEEEYDPISVSLAIRIKIEKNVFDKLPSDAARTQFINTNRTRKKLEYADGQGTEFPEFYYLLGVIYNDIAHLNNPNGDNHSPWHQKLENQTIKTMVKLI